MSFEYISAFHRQVRAFDGIAYDHGLFAGEVIAVAINAGHNGLCEEFVDVLDLRDILLAPGRTRT